MSNVLVSKWKITLKVVGNFFTFGRNREVVVLSANKKSPNSPDGITTILFGGAAAGVIKQKTGSYYTPIVIDKSIVNDWML